MLSQRQRWWADLAYVSRSKMSSHCAYQQSFSQAYLVSRALHLVHGEVTYCHALLVWASFDLCDRM